jgi:mono/diheme cytochrome c family protein
VRRVLLLVLLASLLAVVAVGCGGDDGTDAEETVVTETTGETTSEGGETTDPAEGEADGSAVFASAGCGGCHTLAAAGTAGSVGPNLDDLQPDEGTVESIVRSGRGAMPSFEGDLSDAEITAVAAYVAESAGS